MTNKLAGGFSNCDIQALEVALHLRHGLGITNFQIVSNDKISHNYVVLGPSENYPKGAIVDTWTGQGFQELSFMNKIKFKHQDGNYTVNHTMQNWVEKYGSQYVID